MPDINYKIMLEGIQFQIVSVWRGATGQVKMHSHGATSYEIHYIESGRGILRTSFGEFELTSGMLYLTGPGVLHEQTEFHEEPVVEIGMYYTVPSCTAISKLEYKTKGRKEWPGTIVQRLIQQEFWIGEGTKEIKDSMLKLLKEVTQKGAGYQLMIPFNAGSLLIELGRLYHSGQKEEVQEEYSPLSEDVKYLYIERAFLDNPGKTTLSSLADSLGLSIRQLQRLMKSHYGITFCQMQLNAKLTVACQLLTTTKMSITEISEKAGFSSLDYFRCCFKQKFIESPSSYRKRFDPAHQQFCSSRFNGSIQCQ
ncbi:helix-turn-helix domain-containing protein [Anaerocolumna jejuensis]|uniref:helix-turn-helix transcriptional regulator n=1 Tax=Anaerocolumna jejuensis TaxID=259063 RepID=UPI003F7BC077